MCQGHDSVNLLNCKLSNEHLVYLSCINYHLLTFLLFMLVHKSVFLIYYSALVNPNFMYVTIKCLLTYLNNLLLCPQLVDHFTIV